MTPDPLVAFLEARLDEDEAIAKAAGEPGGQFSRSGAGFAPEWKDDRGAVSSSAGQVVFDEGNPSEAQSAHIARHDPARVLREVEAKRAIVRRCAGVMNEMDVYPNGLVSPRALLARQTLIGSPPSGATTRTTGRSGSRERDARCTPTWSSAHQMRIGWPIRFLDGERIIAVLSY